MDITESPDTAPTGNQPETYIAVIGDLIDSRTYPNQAELLESTARQFSWVNDQVPSLQPISPTVGDEFQGLYADVEYALAATLLVRLRLFVEIGIESRFGLGQGTVTVTQAAEPPFAQSGTAWWEARAALDDLAEGKRSWPRTARSAYRGDDGATVNALLIVRDELLAAMDARDGRITLGLFAGERQKDLARELGISQPAVSQRLHRGPLAVYVAHNRMVTQ